MATSRVPTRAAGKIWRVAFKPLDEDREAMTRNNRQW